MKKILFTGFLLISILLSLMVGVMFIPINHLFAPDETEKLLILTLRLPRTVSLLIAGAALSVSGLLMQQITQNKFVSPTTAGTMASARLGIILAMVFFGQQSLLHKTLFAFVFSIIGTILFAHFLKTIQLKQSMMIPLVGLMFGNVIGAFGTFIAYQFDLIQNATSWLQGDLSLISSENYGLIYITLPLMLMIYLFSHYFSVLNLGKQQVTGLGVSFEQIEMIGIMIVAIASAGVLLTVGNIPFIGLIIPNVLSLKSGDHFRKLLFPTAYSGAVFLIWCDIFSRIIVHPYEVPVSLTVGVIGTILFLFLLLKGERA
ncbi:ABC transporter permease [Marinilactibacillus kalidii]|uniref:ABC transporter permease n=1 Tax=Marinilactibacillus kalidii TaxID=2820274 RepID=UPI001ABE2151|nr:iron chelate uptake ABC transporter family permease subunit [Marinilactibacillus kalidii]